MSSANSSPSTAAHRRRQNAHRQPRKFSRLQPHRARLHGGRRGYFLEQRHPRRPRAGGRSRRHGRAHRGASILPDRPLRHHRRLLENRAGRAAVHDRGRQPGGNSRDQSGRPGAQWLHAGKREIDQGSVSPDLPLEIQHPPGDRSGAQGTAADATRSPDPRVHRGRASAASFGSAGVAPVLTAASLLRARRG